MAWLADWLERVPELAVELLPFVAVLAALCAGLVLTDRALSRRERPGQGRFARQVWMLVLTALAILVAIVALPVSDATRGQLLSLLGIVLTAVIALASTSFVGNAMAGLMLRSIASFKPGDFVRVGECFGRVTERGLVHTEVQTEDRDLTMLPNLYLVTQPVTVVRASGTIVSAELSLGYDVAHDVAEPPMLEAAREAGLEEPFVQITSLGDHSVGYRVAGLLPDVTHLLSKRSGLRKGLLDHLHEAGIEILSPNWMAQRPAAPDEPVIPAQRRRPRGDDGGTAPEAVMFDKAERAGELEALRQSAVEAAEAVAQLEAARDEAPDEAREGFGPRIERARARRERLEAELARAEERTDAKRR